MIYASSTYYPIGVRAEHRGRRVVARPTSDDILHQIRAAANAARERGSLREAAREVGMSPTGLSNFLSGARPYPSTLRKLQSWYVREGTRHVEVSASEALAAIVLLTEGIPAEHRGHCLAELLALLSELYRESRPDWIPVLLVRAAR